MYSSNGKSGHVSAPQNDFVVKCNVGLGRHPPCLGKKSRFFLKIGGYINDWSGPGIQNRYKIALKRIIRYDLTVNYICQFSRTLKYFLRGILMFLYYFFLENHDFELSWGFSRFSTLCNTNKNGRRIVHTSKKRNSLTIITSNC